MPAGLAHARLTPLLVKLLEDPRAPWTVGSIAARALLSRHCFAQEFRKVVRITPADFLTRVRVALAQRLLHQGRLVTLVAKETGYGRQPAFQHAFICETCGIPSAWARTMASRA